ncbi:MAG: YggS family pyridoxal phosphate-dependent enzyme [Paludibacteraceae bacterium]|nr:YggS family pyridoxal phosphate-dependent enzyme [Paludibacteraceae bacterium]
MSNIAENIKNIRGNVPSSVKLVCVSKFHPCEAIMEAYNAGERCFGENRPQEMVEKAKTLPNDIQWHFIGNLQTNKVKMVVPYAVMIQSMSNERLVDEIEKCAARLGKIQDVLIELHVAQEETKQGFTADEAIALFTRNYVDAHPHIRICGVMGMASNTDNVEIIKNDFRKIKQTYDTLRNGVFADDPHFNEVSMGMSGDYLLGIETGSTIVRVGSAIFGARQY